MVVLTSATSVLGTACDELRLSVRHGSGSSQTISLTQGKCTIGSAPNSTLRLLAPGVQPCQCLILRGRHGTIVRSWANNTRLNGRQFNDRPLAIGDRLSCGPVEIEVPRDRDGSFEPTIVRKRQRRLNGIDQIVLSLTVRGMTTGEIAAHFAVVWRHRQQGHHQPDHRRHEQMGEWRDRPPAA